MKEWVNMGMVILKASKGTHSIAKKKKKKRAHSIQPN